MTAHLFRCAVSFFYMAVFSLNRILKGDCRSLLEFTGFVIKICKTDWKKTDYMV